MFVLISCRVFRIVHKRLLFCCICRPILVSAACRRHRSRTKRTMNELNLYDQSGQAHDLYLIQKFSELLLEGQQGTVVRFGEIYAAAKS